MKKENTIAMLEELRSKSTDEAQKQEITAKIEALKNNKDILK